MKWIDKKLTLAIHARQLAEHGGSEGIRDETLLESALGRPQHLHAYGEPKPDLAALAASLGFGIARNPPFIDGNKRTAFVTCRAFLVINEVGIIASQKEKYETFLALAEGSIDEQELAEWIRQHLNDQKSNAIHESSSTYTAEA